MTKDIFKTVFTESTQVKLSIFRSYIKEWLPVFIASKKTFWDTGFIYDYFAGEGYDISGNPGSPIILLEEIKSHCQMIKEKNLKISLHFNELDKRKADKLKLNINNFLNECKSTCTCIANSDENCVFKINYYEKKFEDFFQEIYPIIQQNDKYPRFMFIDQYGIKNVPEKVFSQLASLRRTDFMFFIASQHIQRFSEQPEFKKYIDTKKLQFDTKKPYLCHKYVYEYYKSLVKSINQDIYVGSFSLKKGNNVYGLIFGSHHPLGIEKFLGVCWKYDKQTGTANFDIYNELELKGQTVLFEECAHKTTLDLFEEELEDKIRHHCFTTLKSVYLFGFEQGFLPAHVNKIIKQLSTSGLLVQKHPTFATNIHKLNSEVLQYR